MELSDEYVRNGLRTFMNKKLRSIRQFGNKLTFGHLIWRMYEGKRRNLYGF